MTERTRTLKTAAMVTVFDPRDMTRRGRTKVAEWLRRQADFLEQHGRDMGPRFCARYLYLPRKPRKKAK